MQTKIKRENKANRIIITMLQLAVHPCQEARSHVRRLERMLHRSHLQKHFTMVTEEEEEHSNWLQVADKWIDQHTKMFDSLDTLTK